MVVTQVCHKKVQSFERRLADREGLWELSVSYCLGES